MLASHKGFAVAALAFAATASIRVRRSDFVSDRLVGRRCPRARGLGPRGKSPALSGPHSEPHVHIRTREIGHLWYTRREWNRLGFGDERAVPSVNKGSGNFPFRVGDVLEFLNGFGQVTKRYRVAA